MPQSGEQSAPVSSAVVNGLAELTLNRPKAINALDAEMVGLMAGLLHDWAADDDIRAVYLTGAGERGLCAGGDIVAIHRDAVAVQGAGDAAAAATGSGAFWRDEYRLNAAIADFPKPYIALMDGIVMGGGVGVSAHGNTRVVTDRTRLAMPEVGIGLVPDVGGTRLLAAIPDELGTYAALTSVHLNGADAVALGLADHYLPAADLEDFRTALRAGPPADALAQHTVPAPASELADQAEWIGRIFAADSVAEIVDGCRTLGTPAALAAADAIAGKSPTALAVTLAALRAARREATLREALVREYRTSLRCLQHADLAEGIRAQVIDKDRSPRWDPATEPSAEAIAAYTAPLSGTPDLTFPADENAR